MAVGLIGGLSQLVIFLTGNLILTTCIANAGVFPEIESVSVINVNDTDSDLYQDVLRQVEIEVKGNNFFGGMQIKFTRTPGERNSVCEDLEDYTISEVYAANNEAKLLLLVPISVQNVFFCIPHYVPQDDRIYWYHQGVGISLSNSKIQQLQPLTV
ncbi:hypothetical protein QE152_g7829 [Popillia japonica]|uniref:Uncharacterized protein n=1 Tax=Popillia japonica TaxID=7064 RepID=A0AAW1ME03_POPJA